jgi:hypothetical protein
MEIEIRFLHHALSLAEKVLEILKGGPPAFIEKELFRGSILRRIRKPAEQVAVTP